MTTHAALAPVTPIMHMGCTDVLITYRAAGAETICLQSAPNGVQQLAGFDAAKGDVIGVDDILEQTPARTDLSDVGDYITSVISGVGTTLYFDPTGRGLQATAIAVLRGVATTVAELVADGGMKYIPDAISVTPLFNTPLALRPAGLQTVDLAAPAPGLAPEQIEGFRANKADVLELRAILDPTTALANLSNVADYISAETVAGDTILSVDVTGAGRPGVAFVQLDGVSLTLAQLLADDALVYDPSAVTVAAMAGATFSFRAAGDETALIEPTTRRKAAPLLQGFDLAAGDALSVHLILLAANLSVTSATLADYFGVTQGNGSSSLWFNAAGNGQPGAVVATLQNAAVSFADLVAAGALKLGAPIVPTPPSPTGTVTPIMRMGCTNVTLTYRAAGEETICLQSASHGAQQLVGFNAAAGDVIGIDDVVEQTAAKADLSDIGNYITSAVSSAGTTLYFDPSGQGLQGTPVAVLQGVDTTVAQLVADGGMKYIPDAISVRPQFDAPLTLRAAGLETVDLAGLAPGLAPEQIFGFNAGEADVLELRRLLNPTTALPDLSNVANYISAQTVDGDTILSVDVTGAGQPGVAFVELDGVSTSVARLMADNALVFDPSAAAAAAPGGRVFTFREEGDETAILPAAPARSGYAILRDFSTASGDAFDLSNTFAASNLNPSQSDLGNYISAVQSSGSTSLWFDATGSGHGGGVELALLQNTSVSFASLVSHGAFHLS